MKRVESGVKKERNYGLIGLVIVFIMIMGSLGFALLNKPYEEVEEFGKHIFVRGEDGWMLSDGSLAVSYLPRDVMNISCPEFSEADLKAEKAYLIAVSNNGKQAFFELYKNFQLFNTVNEACLPSQANLSVCRDLPLKDCDDSDGDTKVMIFSDSGKDFISYSEGCLEVSGNGTIGLIKAADRVVYEIAGIL